MSVEPNYEFIAKELQRSVTPNVPWAAIEDDEQEGWIKLAERAFEICKSIFAANQVEVLKDAFKRDEPVD